MNRIPASALLLGLAGLVPFLWAALLVLDLFAVPDWPLPTVLGGDGRLIMIRYGGIILPFMSGVLWGFATNGTGRQAAAAYALSVLPALWWFLMPGEGVTSALINLMTGFIGLLILDYAFYRWDLAPQWWMSLRIQLTVIVLACLCIGVFL
ncbi:DUF3429 domain-containing protein [Sulfitobacter sp. F26204]|uniref:DUF3429 domain-containing protein n=1 Tax=Sulfitobacter sp. F26204 TaxID=2996014 RepID=UPI00225E3C93|nr:DUF3429 domain-containing protein [Sulfitobacter sp. F26204]MCX7558643.1 DUF3429 domain-containing protein [Sulfitobacter sp. F26204]